MTDAGAIVRSFLTLLMENDAPGAVALLDPEVEWKNTGLPTIRGRRVGGMLLDMEKRHVGFAVELDHLAVSVDDPGVVLTDRTDIISVGRWSSAFWVCGTFEVRDGLITVWDDHFSLGNVLKASVLGLGRAVLPWS